MSINDIDGSKPKKKKLYETRESQKISDIVGTSPKK